MSKRFEIRTDKGPIAWPPIPIGRDWYWTKVRDLQTGQVGRGEGETEEESRRRAFKDLYERQGM